MTHDFPPGTDKRTWRTHLRARRDALSPTSRAEWSLQLAGHGLEALRQHAAGAVVAAFWPMRSEVDPRPLAMALAGAGASLCLPAFVGDDMLFRAWSPADELVAAGFSTFEPRADAAPVVPTLVLAPLLGFDRRGVRLGWGKGCYDRYLAARSPRPFVVGVAFSCQEVAELPADAHDQRLDAVVTERCYRRW
ncbi:MAG: 5-formyltetrahydrofolate cyclo-ligase [Planctomycetes bacterium]|nr:5-formyltetrahydrofolate cyclo-ligase [Planctomycetota bacterium]MCC7399734.1 5-formyltetrahydrofolate cyclo-ligase [Planctomycetota bacterium]